MTPEGWDNPDPELVEAARQLRGLYLALQGAGFTAWEAAMVIGAQIAANTALAPPKPDN